MPTTETVRYAVPEKVKCPICGRKGAIMLDGLLTDFCRRCQRRYPWPLLKATKNNWYFYAKLVTGELIRFPEASIKGKWVTLKEPTILSSGSALGLQEVLLGRGVVVQLNQIVWCVDQDS